MGSALEPLAEPHESEGHEKERAGDPEHDDIHARYTKGQLVRIV
jgi:hypothetical protein